MFRSRSEPTVECVQCRKRNTFNMDVRDVGVKALIEFKLKFQKLIYFY